MGKRAKRQNRETRKPKSHTKNEVFTEEDMDDEIDAFHKQRDVIPLDIDGDVGGASDEDIEQPVLDIEVDDDDDDNDVDSDSDEAQLTGLAAKISRQEKFLRQKIGGVEDEMHDDVEEEEQRMSAWGRRKDLYYSADNIDYELQSSDEDLPAEEEAEVLKLQREKAKSFSMKDFGLEEVDQDDSDSDERAKSLEDFMVEEREMSKLLASEVAEGDIGITYEVKKDLNSLSKEEQMDVVFSSAPELIGLLSELKDALDQLESKVKPLLCKAKERRNTNKDGIRYLEVKQLLLLAYCQAITFYLLLKSEGHPVRDHPVIARLVGIKNLLDKIKHIDGRLPSQIEEILNQDHVVKRNAADEFEPCTTNHEISPDLAKTCEVEPVCEIDELVKASLPKGRDSKHEKSVYQNNQAGLQSMEMLKIRASLEEKLKRKGIYSSETPKTDGSQKHLLQPLNRRLDTLDDFDDEVIDKDAVCQGVKNDTSSLHLGKLSQLVAAKVNKPKVVSGDDDLPKRDDIGERRRKHELRILAKAGAESMDDFGDEVGITENGAESMDFDLHNDDEETHESEDEFYKEVKQQRAVKLSAKEELYSRTTVPALMETTVDGKRQITYQMEKNRGLTRARKKLTKIPRKKYKLKHQKAVVRRKGQVRDIKRPSGPYGGEVSGINAGISRSIRFKN